MLDGRKVMNYRKGMIYSLKVGMPERAEHGGKVCWIDRGARKGTECRNSGKGRGQGG